MLGEIFDKAALIFGCGNILLGDDGFGPAVVAHLQKNYVLPEHVLALDVGTGVPELLFDLLLSEKKPQKIFIIDAVDRPGRQPGVKMGSVLFFSIFLFSLPIIPFTPNSQQKRVPG